MFCVYNALFTSNIVVYAQITMLVSFSLQYSSVEFVDIQFMLVILLWVKIKVISCRSIIFYKNNWCGNLSNIYVIIDTHVRTQYFKLRQYLHCGPIRKLCEHFYSATSVEITISSDSYVP